MIIQYRLPLMCHMACPDPSLPRFFLLPNPSVRLQLDGWLILFATYTSPIALVYDLVTMITLIVAATQQFAQQEQEIGRW